MLGKLTPEQLLTREDLAQKAKQYQADNEAISQLSKITDEIKIVQITGLWCPDCIRDTPALIAVLQRAANANIKLEFIGVDRAKKAPNDALADYQFERIPTTIVMLNNQEVGRIVEKAQDSLEQDLFNIIKQAL
ncbi:thioredoxin family protein [Paraferrimonas sp. SM1919]|uniref:thioredoxin family protein n=1 Tax=Paraferrimonas sp. SM1919 TaxID=2662263 RepID=UPI0013D6DBDA|nr:thioredoxin family protein [Paraferrimonas sp. SM1919]